MEKKNLTGPALSLLKVFFVSAVFSTLLLLLAAAVFYAGGIGGSLISVVVKIVWFLAALTGGFLSAKVMGSRRLLWGLAFGALYFLCLLLLSWGFAVTAEGPFSHSSSLLMALGLCLVGGAVGGLAS